MIKDWTGNRNSVFKTLGASNHTDKERERDDFYATDPVAIDLLLKEVELPHRVWEPACGSGCLSRRLEELGHEVVSTDLVDRGYGVGGVDFLGCDNIATYGTVGGTVGGTIDEVSAVVTNPPYKYAKEFVLKALEVVPDGGLVCMFLKTTFAEGKGRYQDLFKITPPLYGFAVCGEGFMCQER